MAGRERRTAGNNCASKAYAAAIRARVAGELRWMGLDVDPVQNEAGALDISSARSALRTLVLAVDEAQEMVGAIATLESHTP